MIASKQSENNSLICTYYPNARHLRYPHFFKNCGLSFKARWLWSFLLYASRCFRGYTLRKLERVSGLDHKTIAKLVASELCFWVKKKNLKIYAIKPPEGAIRQKTDSGKWQDRMASVPLLVPVSKKIKPLEAVILAVLGSQEKTQNDLIRICAVDKNTLVSHKKRLVELCLITEELQLCVPTDAQRSWFKRRKKIKPPTYNPDLPNVRLLLERGYSENAIDEAVVLGWLSWSEGKARNMVRDVDKTHEENRSLYPNLESSERLFLYRLKKKAGKKPAQPTPLPAAPAAPLEDTEQVPLREKMLEHGKQRIEQQRQRSQSKPVQDCDDMDFTLDEDQEPQLIRCDPVQDIENMDFTIEK